MAEDRPEAPGPAGESAGHDTFASDWLRLREPVDHRSRSAELVAALDRAGRQAGWTSLVDLGSGRGSNLRYLATRLGWGERWTALDHDPALLAELEAPEGLELDRVRGDLRREGLDAAAEHDVVTASALLDLVTAGWVHELAATVAARGTGVLIALSWNGEIRWADPDPVDDELRAAVRDHQRGEKGMGQALGPEAIEVATEALGSAGMEVRTAPSPWRLGGDGDAALAGELLDGWIAAAVETHPGAESRFAAWRARRLGDLRGGDYTLVVGHTDLLALPRGIAR